MQIPNFEESYETRPKLDRFWPNFEDFTKLEKWPFFCYMSICSILKNSALFPAIRIQSLRSVNIRPIS